MSMAILWYGPYSNSQSENMYHPYFHIWGVQGPRLRTGIWMAICPYMAWLGRGTWSKGRVLRPGEGLRTLVSRLEASSGQVELKTAAKSTGQGFVVEPYYDTDIWPYLWYGPIFRFFSFSASIYGHSIHIALPCSSLVLRLASVT